MTSYFIGGYVYQGEGSNEVNESAICIAEESNNHCV